MSELNKVDVLFVGAGPANLAGAIKLKQHLNEHNRSESVVIIEKSARPGYHNLSGAVFEAGVLDNLDPDWQKRQEKFLTGMLANQVKKDELVFLRSASQASRIPRYIVPKSMRHQGNYIASVGDMVGWLDGIAARLGVEIYNSFAARELVLEDGRLRGIKLGEKGLDKEGNKLANYIPGEAIEAKVTVLGEGAAGQLAEELIDKLNLRQGRNPQIYSLGVKELIRLPAGNPFGDNRVIHTLGYPVPSGMFGGGTLYSMGDNMVAISLIVSLDWRYCNFNPQEELQRFKAHPYIKSLIGNGTVTAYGARLIPEGGYYSLPRLYTDGALITGDDAGLTNARKLKGLHYAIQSGIFAAETIYEAIAANDFTSNSLKKYQEKLDNSFVIKDLRAARNYRQLFTRVGLLGGAPLSFVQQWLPRMSTKPDYAAMRRSQLNRKDPGGMDRLSAVNLSGTAHREDEPSHITFTEEGQDKSCFETFGCHPCASFCPAEVYKFVDDKLILSPSNCIHCQTCRLKCPNQVIRWVVPEGGDGPRYKGM